MESPILILVIGLVIGVLLTAKSAKDVVESLPPVAFNYILFGLFLFGATWALQGWGMAAVLVAYGLYQIIGRRAGGIANVLSWLHLKRKPKPESTPTAPAPTAPDPVPIAEAESNLFDSDGRPGRNVD